jgi:cytochrome c biogenesis protein CcmG, thiol:disulfide interchange protein DsbE
MSETSAEAGESEQAAPRRLRPKHLAQAVAITAVVALLGLLAWRVVRGEAGSGFVAAIREGKRPVAPEFALPVIWKRDENWPPQTRRALADGTLSLRELRGYPVVVNFWASWCIPCKEEAPELAAGARRYRGRVVFLGIDIQDFTGDARKFMDDVDASYVSVRDGTSKTSASYGLTGVPETYYVDRRGRAVFHSIGAVSKEDLETGIRAALRSES